MRIMNLRVPKVLSIWDLTIGPPTSDFTYYGGGVYGPAGYYYGADLTPQVRINPDVGVLSDYPVTGNNMFSPLRLRGQSGTYYQLRVDETVSPSKIVAETV